MSWALEAGHPGPVWQTAASDSTRVVKPGVLGARRPACAGPLRHLRWHLPHGGGRKAGGGQFTPVYGRSEISPGVQELTESAQPSEVRNCASKANVSRMQINRSEIRRAFSSDSGTIVPPIAPKRLLWDGCVVHYVSRSPALMNSLYMPNQHHGIRDELSAFRGFKNFVANHSAEPPGDPARLFTISPTGHFRVRAVGCTHPTTSPGRQKCRHAQVFMAARVTSNRSASSKCRHS